MANIGYIQVTRQCNQRCRFCSNPETDYNLEIDEARAMVNNLVALGYYGVIFTGGEPTLSPILPEMLSYARQKGLQTRIITNGQRIADQGFLNELIEAGLNHVNISIHTHHGKLQDFLTDNPGSMARIEQALKNLGRAGITIDVNTVINRYNANHLDAIVHWIIDRFPFIWHFVWNNLDTTMGRVSENTDTIPGLTDFEISLHRAMNYLHRKGRTFRVERVPLCYMTEYAFCSTETRKIVKEEERIVHFLDDKGAVRQTQWHHVKGDCCSLCRLNAICAGIFDPSGQADLEAIYPVFVSPDEVIEAVHRDIDHS